MNPFQTTATSNSFLCDNSMLELATTCPYLAYLSVIRRLKPAGDSPALRFGGFIHRALAYRYKLQGFGRPNREDIQLRVLTHSFMSSPLEIEGWRNLDSAVKCIRGYNNNYPKEDFEIAMSPSGLPYVEQPFVVNTGKCIRGRDIFYMGRIDAKVVVPNGSVFTLDHKTTSMMGDSFWADQQVTQQHPGYVWADREVTGEEATGYIVNAICTRPTIQEASCDESGKVVAGKTKGGKESKAVPVEYMRNPFFTKVPPGQIDEWFENMLMQVDLFLYCVDRCGDNPLLWERQRHRKHCVTKYGLCQFYNLCALPLESREPALAGGAYTKNEWTPLYK